MGEALTSDGTHAEARGEETTILPRAATVRPRATTKVCPRCGEELFSDMDVCYGCLYDFSRQPRRTAEPEEAYDLDEPDDLCGDPPWDEGLPPASLEDLDATAPLLLPHGRIPSVERESLWVRSADMETVVPIGRAGVTVGRSPACDVVLHSMAVSRRHVRFDVEAGVLQAQNLDAKNPATIGGREITTKCPVEAGQTVNVCGTLFTYLAPQA